MDPPGLFLHLLQYGEHDEDVDQQPETPLNVERRRLRDNSNPLNMHEQLYVYDGFVYFFFIHFRF